MAGPVERYQKLGLEDSLSRMYHYPSACKELSFILRLAYTSFPKNLQSLVFQDTLTAFRLLPQMQTKTAISVANLLLQAAEAVMPKQKRVLAVAEFKHAMVAYKRRSKAQHEEQGVAQLPQDVLVHIFSFLDMRSLVSAALVCRSWNGATSDNQLWQLQYDTFFSISDNSAKNKKYARTQEGLTGVNINWRNAFKRAYKVSITELPQDQKHPQIVEYIMDDFPSLISSSDSDSDTDEGSISKLWAYPRRID
ncbi:hypothetical protein RJ639_015917 [Escallonia herrerae]|uniref:F-box domain-containing protein n=1 Tax=Escallonia herrerae TaxID=1293975 RepID=A0AA88VG09_9ASTE|nr:hypothetical protein RJ639_015917 [Escallonia herrerae]